MTNAKKHMEKAHVTMMEDGYGVVTIDLIYSPTNADDIALQAINDWIMRVGEFQSFCLFCTNQWTSLKSLKRTPPAAFAIIKPRCDDPRTVLATSICEQCNAKHSKPENVLTAVVGKYKQLRQDDTLKPICYTHMPIRTKQ